MTKIGKIANDIEHGNVIKDKQANKPHGIIQWKGTDVCMDIHCKCGHHSHFDAYYANYVQCPTCNTIYMCNEYVELIEIKNIPVEYALKPELED